VLIGIWKTPDPKGTHDEVEASTFEPVRRDHDLRNMFYVVKDSVRCIASIIFKQYSNGLFCELVLLLARA